jgi:hypothetical protein
MGALVKRGYEASIDFGAHPNPRAIYDHLQPVNEPEAVAVSLVGLHHQKAPEVTKSLVACMDHGVIIAAILSLIQTERSHSLFAEIQRISDMKNLVVDGLLGSGWKVRGA